MGHCIRVVRHCVKVMGHCVKVMGHSQGCGVPFDKVSFEIQKSTLVCNYWSRSRDSYRIFSWGRGAGRSDLGSINAKY